LHVDKLLSEEKMSGPSTATPTTAATDAGCGFKCNNCKALFSTVDIIKEHYKSEWHILNSKRRAQNLLPLSKEEFKKVKGLLPQPKKPPALPQSLATSAPSSSGAATSPSKAPTQPSVQAQSVQSLPKPPSGNNKSNYAPPAPPAATSAAAANEMAVVTEDGAEAEEEQTFEELEVDPLISLFDSRRFDTVEECLAHMSRSYGFYIPDEKYVVDMSELLEYLGGKIKAGGMCLFCNRQFRSAYACQNHMKDMGHCKVAYQEDDDIEELEDFYDYFEDEDGDNEDDEDEEEGEAYVSNIGELVLPDGRTVGNRAFKIYYKQRPRPVDDRPSVLAVEREQILRLGGIFGGQKVSNDELVKMSEGELRSLVMKYQKEERRGQIVEQRWHMRRQMLDQKREYRSTVDKARSSATTTAKIRDYHKTVM
jgi:pre-60S factor REI1